MSGSFELNAELRTDEGKGASRRLRRLQNKVPAIVYGGGKDPASISLELKDLVKSLENEAFYSHILSLNIDGKPEQVVIKDLQRHPAKNTPMHADFLRIDANHKIHMQVPLHFINEDICVGVKMQGGAIAHQANEVEIICLPKDLPEYIEVDMAKLENGQSVHLSELSLPAGVELAALIQGQDHDLSIATVNAPKGSDDEDAAEGDAAAEGEDSGDADDS